MLRHSSRLTLPQTDDGADGFLRERADGRLQVGHEQRRRQALAGDVRDRDAERAAERQRVETVAADAVGRLPGDRELMPLDLRHGGREQTALDQPRVLELPLLPLIAPPRGPRVGDLALEDLEQRDVLPRLLHEALGAAAHRLDGGIDAAPPGHDDDRHRPDRASGRAESARALPGRTSCRVSS